MRKNENPVPAGYISLLDLSRSRGLDLVDLVVAKDRGEFWSREWCLSEGDGKGEPPLMTTIVKADIVPPADIRHVSYAGERGVGEEAAYNSVKYNNSKIAQLVGVTKSRISFYLSAEGLSVTECRTDEQFQHMIEVCRRKRAEAAKWCNANNRPSGVCVVVPPPVGYESVPDAAQRWGVAAGTAYEWIRRGMVRAIEFNGVRFVMKAATDPRAEIKNPALLKQPTENLNRGCC